jgi:hypothetical protein
MRDRMESHCFGVIRGILKISNKIKNYKKTKIKKIKKINNFKKKTKIT